MVAFEHNCNPIKVSFKDTLKSVNMFFITAVDSGKQTGRKTSMKKLPPPLLQVVRLILHCVVWKYDMFSKWSHI